MALIAKEKNGERNQDARKQRPGCGIIKMADGRFKVGACRVLTAEFGIYECRVVEQVILINKPINTPAQKRKGNAQNANELSEGVVGDDIIIW